MHINGCVRSLLAQQVPEGGLEIIIADGMSDDGTREILDRLAAENDCLRIIDNPGRVASTGLNAAIRAAGGDIIVRMDAHTEYAPDYVVRCLETLERTGADNVGGPARTRSRGFMQRAICAAYHTSCVIGGAKFHNVDYEGELDTVTYGCWAKSSFDRFGLFDESLVRNEDDEHNLRIIKAGGRIWQSPAIMSWYAPRCSLKSLFVQYFRYGYWRVRVIRKHRSISSFRHLAPGAFVFLLFFLLALTPVSRGAMSVLQAALALYGIYLLAASGAAARRFGWVLLAPLPIVIATFQLSYGLGFFLGVLDLVRRKRDVRRGNIDQEPLRRPVPEVDRSTMGPAGRDLPFVTVIMPVRNEAGFIERSLDAALAQEYPSDRVELVITDGMSDDATREIIRRVARRNPERRIRLVDNPRKIVSTGLNAAIRAARGEVIVRMDAHTEYARDYILRCVEVLSRTGADNVGGPARTKAEGYIQRAVAAAYHSPFSVGGAKFHDVGYEGAADTVTYGCWRREAFESFGLFDEKLVRNQDDEHNLRIVREGGLVWQSPSIRSWYSPRSSLRALFRQYAQYGYWKVPVILKHGTPASPRHFAPGAFILVFFCLATASLFEPKTLIPLSVLLAAYALWSLSASFVVCRHEGWDLLPVLPLVFAAYHFGYGYGFLRGVLDFTVLGRGGTSTGWTKLTRDPARGR